MITTKDFQLCNPITEVELTGLDKSQFQANIKFDGTRIIAVVDKGDVILVNRRGYVCNIHFREVVEELKTFKDCILDGEVISLDDNFTKLQSRAGTKNKEKLKELEKTIPVKYVVFDILAIDGTASQNLITNKALKERIEQLKELFKDKALKSVELAEYNDVDVMLSRAKEQKKEGIVIKDINSLYEHRRTNSWLKLKMWCEKDIIFTKYEVNNAGIRVTTDNELVSCQISGEQSGQVQELLNKNGKVELTIQYLTENKETGGLRFPSFHGLTIGEINQ
jgi:ATP-dependent DNA ligase